MSLPDHFPTILDSLGPFETAPRLAVAVSGGADSLCLTLLAEAWARKQGGSVLALTVDHGLRPESAAEAEQVGRWLAARGIAHRILHWRGDKPAAGIQAAARAARYGLLVEACRAEGILHLLLGHHLGDQAETLLQRLSRGSGVDGLAAMPSLVELESVRLLRPLLDIPKSALEDHLRALGQPWIEDPSNRNTTFGRVRLRDALAGEGASPERLAATARRMGRARAALEAQTTTLAARIVAVEPTGCARVAGQALCQADEEIALRLLSRLLACIGGAAQPPRIDRVERLWTELRGGLPGTRSVAGCLVVPKADGLLVCREPASLAAPLTVAVGQAVTWDGRFRICCDQPVTVGALGEEGWRAICAEAPELRKTVAIPALVRLGLPAIRRAESHDPSDICAVPGLGYNRQTKGGVTLRSYCFAPLTALTPVGHAPAKGSGSPCGAAQ